jgi:hypothetical protein
MAVAAPDISTSAGEMGDQAQAGFVLVSAAVLDGALERPLLAKMRDGMSSRIITRMVKGYRPLKQFASKIDLWYAILSRWRLVRVSKDNKKTSKTVSLTQTNPFIYAVQKSLAV